MNFPFPRGRARRVLGLARRRAGFFAPTMIEPLEERRLLAAGNFGLNVEISPFSSFVNLLQTPGSWLTAPGESNQIVLNSSNDPSSDAVLLFDLRVNQPWNGPDPNAVAPNLSGTYHLSFNGQAVLQDYNPASSTTFTVQNRAYNASTNTTTADLVVPTSNTSDFFAIDFLNTQAAPNLVSSTGDGTGFTNASLIRPGYAAGSTQLYTNEFLSALKPYSVLRYLDPENTNGQPYVNGNTLVTVDAPQVDQTGMPWEYLIALANQTQTDMWVNVPEGATNAYVSAMAGIFKDGGTVNGVSYPGLNPNLKVYLEYSNEVWGGIPFNEYYQESAVQNVATNQPLSTFPSNLDVYNNPDGTSTTSVYVASSRRYLERTNDIGQIFQGVLGSDPTHQRIRPVLGWQENNPSFYPGALDWFQHFFGPAGAAFYGMGNANYWNPTDYSSVDNAINSLAAQETAYAIPDNVAFSAVARSYGLKNVSYEGGPGIGADGSTAAGQVALAAARDPRMEQLILQHYLDFYADGGDLAMYYNGPFGTWSPSNEWSLAEQAQYGNPTASAKYRGTVDVSNAAPVAVSGGIQVTANAATSLGTASDSINTSFSNPNSGQRNFWLVDVASAGTFDLQLTTGSSGGQAPGQVEVFVGTKQVGGIFNVGASTTVDLGNLALSAGLNALSIYVVHGMNDSSQGNASYYQFQPRGLTLLAPGGSPVSDPSFEATSVGAGTYQYDPSTLSWTFKGFAGIAANNSAFTYGNPAAPLGSQVAILQQTGTITQPIVDMATGAYTISFDAAQRGNDGVSAEDFQILVDGNVVGTFKPTGTAYQLYTTNSFAVAAGTHSIQFLGLDSIGGDNTAFLDAISIAVATTPPPAPMVGDAGFEEIAVGAGNYQYDPSGSTWGFAGLAGLTGNNSAFTLSNPAAPQGSQAAFLEETGTISAPVAILTAGSYTLSFDSAQRKYYSVSNEDFEVLVDGSVVGNFRPSGISYQIYTTNAFTVTAGVHMVQFLGLDSVGGDNTAFLDSVSVASTTSTSPPPTPTVGDAGFESVAIGPGTFAYNPTGSAWTFSGYTAGGGSGVSGNNSGFTYGNPTAPQGSQVAFLQAKATITQSVANWAAGSYTISFDAAQRGNNGVSAEDFEVLVDGNVVGNYKPYGVAYQLYTTNAFTVSAGAHTIQFLGLDSVGGDNTAFLDAVSVAVATSPPPVPAVGDAGFEAIPLGPGNFLYDPNGSPWAFAGSAGVSANNSGFTSGNPGAPQGSQVAFLQKTGGITQSVANWAAGTYSISFAAAQRNYFTVSNEDFEVLVDGVVVGTFKPTGTSYQPYTTKSFTVSAGTHSIQFLGLDSAGGDNTALLDNVTITT